MIKVGNGLKIRALSEFKTINSEAVLAQPKALLWPDVNRGFSYIPCAALFFLASEAQFSMGFRTAEALLSTVQGYV